MICSVSLWRGPLLGPPTIPLLLFTWRSRTSPPGLDPAVGRLTAPPPLEVLSGARAATSLARSSCGIYKSGRIARKSIRGRRCFYDHVTFLRDAAAVHTHTFVRMSARQQKRNPSSAYFSFLLQHFLIDMFTCSTRAFREETQASEGPRNSQPSDGDNRDDNSRGRARACTPCSSWADAKSQRMVNCTPPLKFVLQHL